MQRPACSRPAGLTRERFADLGCVQQGSRRQPPGHRFDCDIRRVETVECAIGLFEQCLQADGIVGLLRIEIESDRNLVLLALISKVRFVRNKISASPTGGVAERRNSLAAHLSEYAAHLAPVQIIDPARCNFASGRGVPGSRACRPLTRRSISVARSPGSNSEARRRRRHGSPPRRRMRTAGGCDNQRHDRRCACARRRPWFRSRCGTCRGRFR